MHAALSKSNLANKGQEVSVASGPVRGELALFGKLSSEQKGTCTAEAQQRDYCQMMTSLIVLMSLISVHLPSSLMHLSAH